MPSLHQSICIKARRNVILIILSWIWHNRCNQRNQSIPVLKWTDKENSAWWWRPPCKFIQSRSPHRLRACHAPHICRPLMRARLPDCSKSFKHSCNLSRKLWLNRHSSTLDSNVSQASRTPKQKRWSKDSPSNSLEDWRPSFCARKTGTQPG